MKCRMAKKVKKNVAIFGFAFGLCMGFLLTKSMQKIFLNIGTCSIFSSDFMPYHLSNPYRIVGMNRSENFLNSDKRLIFIGVMTTNNFTNTRAQSIFETWGKTVPGKIAFFTAEQSEDAKMILPLVKLPGVDDSYPPQKKSFLMLKYMYDHLLNHFEYFMRADDDVYIRTDKLEKFLRSVNSSHPQFIGQPGMGTSEELGHLGLKEGQNFCMGGPGIIFSHATLAAVAPHIRDCLKALQSTHEDVEIGRCVQKYAGIPCTWSYEMQTLFYHNSSGIKAFTGSLKSREVHTAITLHPVKNHLLQYRIHTYMQHLAIKDLETETMQLMRELHELEKELGIEPPVLDKPSSGFFIDHLGKDDSYKGWCSMKNRRTLEWNHYTVNAYQLGDDNPRHRIFSGPQEGQDDVIRDVMMQINSQSREKGRTIDFKKCLYSYQAVNPGISANYIVDLLLIYKKFQGKKMTVPVRRHAYVQVPFGPLYVRESDPMKKYRVRRDEDTSEPPPAIIDHMKKVQKKSFEVPPSIWKPQRVSEPQEKITLILPLAGRFQTFLRFMENFKNFCLAREENIRLIVVSFQSKDSEPDTREDVEAVISSLQLDYPSADLMVLQVNDTFARALALEVGAAHCSQNDLLFFVDVDMIFNGDVLERVRSHTVQGKQVYYPIVFSEYDPQVTRGIKPGMTYDHFLINEYTGYWRSFGYGIASIYLSDLRAVGGLDTGIKGWGKEDVDLFDKIIQSRSLRIFRSVDPGLIHVFHIVDCDTNLTPDQLKMCEGTLYNTYASSHLLTKMIKENPEMLTYKRHHG